MAGYLIRRLLLAVVTLLVGSFLSFLLVASAGDPLAELRLRPGATEAQIRALEAELGLDGPVVTRYWTWLTGFVRGDWGRSIAMTQARADVYPAVMEAASITARLVAGAVVLALLLGVLVGVLQAVAQYSIFDYVATGLAYVMFSMPVFCVAVAVKAYAIKANDLLEFVGMGRWITTAGSPNTGFTGTVVDVVYKYTGTLLLPTVSLVLVSFAGYSRFQRASMLEVLNSDYVRTAKAKGISQSRVVVRHALRNALIPVFTMFSMDVSGFLGGAIIVETVFGWPGMGNLLVNSVRQYDPHMLMGWLMVTATMVVLCNLAADLLYAVLDPRIRVT